MARVDWRSAEVLIEINAESIELAAKRILLQVDVAIEAKPTPSPVEMRHDVKRTSLARKNLLDRPSRTIVLWRRCRLCHCADVYAARLYGGCR